ncbi:hypothetical protein M5J15_05015 [Serratia symbiotica]|uniref:hypothetical protein n=1 Tax=Serratia symbiotica TaxID=138074 RepID=UPI002090A6A8|nr:hypothetical protein [Serratia symbiotica]USS96358.1 hypothetical protein M5J15_05015 [Serratia symbiotica]
MWQYVLNISQHFTPLRENDARQTAALTVLTRTPHNDGRRQVLKMATWFSVGSLLGWGYWRQPPRQDHAIHTELRFAHLARHRQCDECR